MASVSCHEYNRSNNNTQELLVEDRNEPSDAVDFFDKQLILEVKKYPVIYNKRRGNKSEKSNAWNKVSDAVNKTGKIIDAMELVSIENITVF